MATDTYLVITDGTTTITFFDGSGGATNYRVMGDGWAPAVATLRADDFGNHGDANDVVETWSISVKGSTAQACLDNIASLQKLLLNAEKFQRGDTTVSPVLVKYSPKGATTSSTANPLQARVLGYVPGEAQALTFPANWELDLAGKIVTNIGLRFVRTGKWLHTDDAASSSATTQGTETTVTMAVNADIPSPTKIQITNSYNGSDGPEGWIVIANGASHMQILDAAITPAGAYSTYNDSGNAPRGGTNVVRYTPAGTTAVAISVVSTLSYTSGKRYIVLASLRNNSSTTSFTVQFGTGFSNTFPVNTVPVVIPAQSSAVARWYSFGELTPQFTTATGLLQVQITASAASGTIDLDSVVLLDAEYVRVFRFQDTYRSGSLGPKTIVFDHRALTATNPRGYETSVLDTWLTCPDDIYIETTGTAIRCLLLQTSYVTSSWHDNSGGTIRTSTWTLTRTRAYLTPV